MTIQMEQTVTDVDNFTKNINVGGGSDLEAGIQFIYDMREHLLDIGLATAYVFVCYTMYLWLNKKFKE
tara:strand:+ start:544 stop:747 length:204 start_codon:yes stop_codon:yes gene_type:complete